MFVLCQSLYRRVFECEQEDSKFTLDVWFPGCTRRAKTKWGVVCTFHTNLRSINGGLFSSSFSATKSKTSLSFSSNWLQSHCCLLDSFSHGKRQRCCSNWRMRFYRTKDLDFSLSGLKV